MTTHSHHPRNDLALAEAALFLAPQPLTRRGLAKILGGVAQAYVDQLLEDLRERFDDPSRGIELHVEDGRAQFRVKSAYINEVAHLAPQHDIPRQELRTLAVIAYNHPMTQANLIKIRGNKGYKHVQELLERNLITSEPHGRTVLLHVTRDFLRHFGLNSVEEFRFHFPTAEEENAEALARETHKHEGLDEDSHAHGEDGTPDATDQPMDPHESITEAPEADPELASEEPPNLSELEESDGALDPVASDVEQAAPENDNEAESSARLSEEVEHG